jgi:monoamine oxidase
VVTEVGWGKSGCTVPTAAGEKHLAHSVICTLPLGVLKAGAVRFAPPLPPRKAEAIAKLGMGFENHIQIDVAIRVHQN